MERKLIGAGRTSEVYEYGDDCILKLFTDEIKLDAVKKEYDFSRFAYENNLPTPEPKEIIYEKNRIGIIYEKINGEPLLKIVMGNVLAIKKIFSKMAELQYKINSIEYHNGAYTFKKYLERAVEENKFITEIEKNNLKGYINKLPDGNKVCHGDFHPENILFSNGKYYIIDWMTGMRGPPAADATRTAMILKNAEIPGKTPFFIRILLRIAQSKMAKMYVKEYRRISGIKKNELDIWELPLYVARLNEKNSKKEEERLIKIIKKLENKKYGHNIKFQEGILMDIKQKETITAYDNSAEDFMEKMGSIKNYNTTYDYLVEKLKENDSVLDLACGPCQIGKYIKEKINVSITGVDLSREMLKIAKNNIPDGVFIEDSIITFKNNIFYDLVIIGFGIPYLNKDQVEKCIKNSVSLLKIKGCMYVSFMDGNKEGFEKTSFGGNNTYYIYYHQKEKIRNVLTENGITIEKEYILDYKEPDGSITEDVIYIGSKNE